MGRICRGEEDLVSKCYGVSVEKENVGADRGGGYSNPSLELQRRWMKPCLIPSAASFTSRMRITGHSTI